MLKSWLILYFYSSLVGVKAIFIKRIRNCPFYYPYSTNLDEEGAASM
jgi:hypothetical protein